MRKFFSRTDHPPTIQPSAGMCLVMMMMMVTQHIPTRHISTRLHICNSFTYYQSIIFPNTIITLLSLSPDFWRDCLILAQCLETSRTKVKVDLDVLQLDCPHSTIAFHGVKKSCLGVLREAPQWESWRRRSTDLFSINMMKYIFLNKKISK